MDAGQGRPGFRPEADPRAVLGAEEIHDRGERPRQPRGREPRGARDPSGHLAHCRAAAALADAELGRVRRIRWRPAPSARTRRCRRSSSRPRARAAARLRRDVRLQLRAHDLVPHADDADADGGRSRQGVRAHLRPRQVARGAHRDRERLHERARPRDRRGQGPAIRSRRGRPRDRQRLPRQRARDRAAHPAAQGARLVDPSTCRRSRSPYRASTSG